MEVTGGFETTHAQLSNPRKNERTSQMPIIENNGQSLHPIPIIFYPKHHLKPTNVIANHKAKQKLLPFVSVSLISHSDYRFLFSFSS